MAKSEVIFKNAQYVNDAVASIFDDLRKKSVRCGELSIWGPIVLPASGISFCGVKEDKGCDNIRQQPYHAENTADIHTTDTLVPKLKIQKTANGQEINDTYNEDEKTGKNSFCNVRSTGNGIMNTEIAMHYIRPEISKNKKRTMSESEKEALESIPHRFEEKEHEKTFQDWCSKRTKDFEEAKSKAIEKQLSGSPTCINKSIKDTNTEKKISSPKEYSKVESNMNSVKDIEMKTRGNPDGADYPINSECMKKKTSKEREKSLIVIKIMEGKGGKSYELMSDLSRISQIKKSFPKFSEVIPDVDSGSKEVNYCVDAVNVIFRYLFNQSYSPVSSPRIGVEVIAASQSWEIDKYHQKFQSDFLQNLTPSNINAVFPHAYHFGLKAVCYACRNICPDNIDLNCTIYKRCEKTCSIIISTYVEPLELCIPFHPLEKCYTMSFDRHIENKILFKVMSGCYVITGIQIQLNEDHLHEKSNEDMLEIDCSIKNSNSYQRKYNQREEKPLRPVNIIYFKDGGLVIDSNEVGEITVEVDTRPYLCSALSKQEMSIKKSKFSLTMQSDFKVEGSDKRLFVIGKLFYHKKKRNTKIK